MTHKRCRPIARLTALSGWMFCALAAAQTNPQVSLDPYTAPQHLAQLKDGRRINLYCSGHGSPTVILTAGLGDWSIAWQRVQSEIAKITRVCSWDRAGFGFSDPGTSPLDIRQSSLDLAGALEAARIRGPYVLVGHSMGGLESLVFADRHRREVSGMVLVDPTIPGQYQTFAKVGKNFTKFAANGRAEGALAAKSCAAYLRSGKPDESAPAGCPPAIAAFYPQAVIAALTPLQSDPDRVIAQNSMVEQMVRSTELGLNPRRNYGAMPVIVLSAPADDVSVPAGLPKAFSFPPDIDPAVLAEVPQMARELQLGHNALARLSTRGSKRIVLGTGHYIPLFRPDVVVSATKEVVELVRQPRGS